MTIGDNSQKHPHRMPFKQLPLWQGVKDVPGDDIYLPFDLTWNDEGYIALKCDADLSAQISELYASSEYKHPTAPPGESLATVARANKYFELINEITSKSSVKWDRVLDIGAGSVILPSHMADEHSVKSYAIVDPSLKNMVKETAKGQLKVVSEYFSTNSLPNEQFDLEISLNCFEHVPDPLQFLKDLRSKINDSGHTLLIFPDTEGQLRFGDLNALWHEHTSYFTESSARALFSKAGFDVVEFRRYLGDLAFLLKPTKTPLPATLPSKDFYEQVVAQFASSLTELRKVILSWVEQDKKIGFHGACAGVNYFFALLDDSTRKKITPSCEVFDGDAAKTGKFLPSFAKPIRSSSDPSYTHCDMMLVATLPFLNEIREYAVKTRKLPPDKVRYIYDFSGKTI